MLKSYPKILPLVGKYSDLVVGQWCEGTEKIDGSQFAFGKDKEGNLRFRSKGQPIVPEEKLDKLFRPAVEYVQSIVHLIPADHAFYGETLCKPRHNTLEYSRVPKNHIALYGVTDYERTTSYPYEVTEQYAEHFGMDKVPLIFRGKLNELKEVTSLIDKESVLGGCKMEGMVLKTNKPMEFSGMIFPFTSLKYVSEEFKEKHSSNPDWIPNKDKLEVLLGTYRTEARWHKAIQHLRDEGKLVGEPKDIGLLIPELMRDLVEEEKENFKDELFKLYNKQWTARATHGFPEFYKKHLLSGDIGAA